MTFTGFPKDSLFFLSDLAKNNSREWFWANKPRYHESFLTPAQKFVTALSTRLQVIAPALAFGTRSNGSGSLMRINRDTRFSQDKSPYRTNISAMFWDGQGKKTERPAFGFQLEADGMGLMVGMFAFPKNVLIAYRDAVDNASSGEDLLAAVKTIRASGDYNFVAAHYKRVPKGYPADHPRADLLRQNALYAYSPRITGDIIHSAELVDCCCDHFAIMAPVYHWLTEQVMGGGAV